MNRTTSSIKDIVHDYMPFSKYELEVIDSPHFQRLHFILQNSVTYVSFPSNKNSRFIHSLGVAHLAGRIFKNSIERADADVIQKFLQEADSIVRQVCFEENVDPKVLQSFWKDDIGNLSRFAHTPRQKKTILSLFPNSDEETPPLFLLNTLCLAVRICGLVHDIGHLPMSHSFELALKDTEQLFEFYSRKEASVHYENHRIEKNKEFNIPEFKEFMHISAKKIADQLELKNGEDTILTFIENLPVHERRSLMILDYIIQSGGTKNLSAQEGNYRRILFRLANLILFATCGEKVKESEVILQKNQKLKFLRGIKKIIASQVDADRLDYVVRDGLSSGCSIGSYDLARIVENVSLCRKNGEFVFAFDERAVSGIEQFFHQRYEGYKYIIYQKTTTRSEAALRELISRLYLLTYSCPDGQIANEMDSFGYVRISKTSGNKTVEEILPSNVENILRLDDANLRSLFFSVFYLLDKRGSFDPSELLGSEKNHHVEINIIYILLKVILFRDFSNLYDPLKYMNISRMPKDIFGDLVPNDESERRTCWSIFLRSFNSSARRNEHLTKLRRRLDELDFPVVPLFSFTPPKIFESTEVDSQFPPVYIRSKDGSAEPYSIEVGSAIMRGAKAKKDEDLCFWLSFLGEDIKGKQEIHDTLRSLTYAFLRDMLDIQLQQSANEAATTR